MLENKELLDKDEIVEPITDQTNGRPVATGMSNGLAKAVIGGVVGAVMGTVAVALANKKTTDSMNRAVKGLGNAVKGATEGFNDTVKGGVDAVKSVALGFNDATLKGAGNTVKGVTEDVKQSVKNTEGIIKDTVEDAKPSDSQDAKISDDQIFQLYEERLVANTNKVKTSEVAITKHIETYTEHISVPLEKERLVIEQTPVDTGTAVVAGEADFYEGELVRMEIYEQTAAIEKQAFVREQVRVRKEVEYNTLEVEDKIRREELNFDIQSSNDLQKNNTL